MKESLRQDGEGYDESGDLRLRDVILDRLVRDQNRHGCDHREYRVVEIPQDEVPAGHARVVEWLLNAPLELVQGLELLLT